MPRIESRGHPGTEANPALVRVYEIVTAHGVEVLLVDARHLKNVPFRKSEEREILKKAAAFFAKERR